MSSKNKKKRPEVVGSGLGSLAAIAESPEAGAEVRGQDEGPPSSRLAHSPTSELDRVFDQSSREIRSEILAVVTDHTTDHTTDHDGITATSELDMVLDPKIPNFDSPIIASEPVSAAQVDPDEGAPNPEPEDEDPEILGALGALDDHGQHFLDELQPSPEVGAAAASLISDLLPTQGSAIPLYDLQDQSLATDSASLDLSHLSPENAATVKELLGKLDELKAKDKKPAKSATARGNFTYKLIGLPKKASATPQVAALQQILYANKLGPGGAFSDSITEKQAFELVEEGKKQGILRTTQPATRILQYYKSKLIAEDCLRVV
jgi:hypothetical protein